ncbi:MAG: DUF4345 family protein [Deltaproteobacteria bacterium]|nr:DUF4345 family protein [Deltaproteobacteria bacterium]
MNSTLGRILLGLPGLFIALSGLMFLLNPGGGAAKLLLTPEGAEGLSNLRGFTGASVFAVGAGIIIGAVTRNLANARPGAIFVLVLIGARVLSYFVDGPNPNVGLYIAIPSVAFAFMVAGHKLIERDHTAGARAGQAVSA